jgi:UrcA family protein
MSSSALTALLAASTLAFSIGSASAVSAADQDPVTATVKYGDLNLTTPGGAKVMLQRIEQAARQVCQYDADIADLPGLRDWVRYCVSTRIEITLRRLDAPMVTAAYSGKSQMLLAERGSH